MDFIFELLFQIIPGKFWVFVLAVLLIAGGVYVWRVGGRERGYYAAATGKESRAFDAEVRHKSIRSVSTSGTGKYDTGSADADFLDLIYQEGSDYRSVEVQVQRDEYDAVKEGDHLRISFHPDKPDYVVTPRTPKPKIGWYWIGGIALIAFGGLVLLMLVVSLFSG
jgi:hypothetical protein